MLITIQSRGQALNHNSSWKVGESLGVAIFRSWLHGSEHSTLKSMDIQYRYRGYSTYNFSGELPYVNHVINLRNGVTDFELVKMALGTVSIIEKPAFTSISTAVDRKHLRMNETTAEPWEAELSNPAVPVTIFSALSHAPDFGTRL